MTLQRPLNYYGSKEKLCPAIYRLIPPGVETWVDLFCGSGIVTLKKPRHPREVVNDLNRDVINLFAVLRGGGAGELYRLLELTPYSQQILAEIYAAEPSPDPITRAWQFLIMSWQARGGDCYQTGFRWSKGQTTAPEITWSRLPQRLAAVAERLRGVCIREVDALRLIDDYDVPGSLLFADPPYPGPVGRRYAVLMAEETHAALARRLAACRARVILTMNPDTIYSEILQDWHRHDVSVLGGGGQVKGELILTNFEPSPLFGGGV
ncbi:DNA adenine methylase [Elstera sp.]|jgi:DNA adenine methylase|uniref:DNA adenine methylase n=1 Tax=Elstera sp. TaxID=1916664 RepID=UPI0037C18F30